MNTCSVRRPLRQSIQIIVYYTASFPKGLSDEYDNLKQAEEWKHLGSGSAQASLIS